MPLPSDLVTELADMPRQLERALRSIPHERLDWKPESWGGSPGETFSMREHVCHLRDIESDGYHVRIQRLLDEANPSLVSLDGYEIARSKAYASADLAQALAAFRLAREATVAQLRGLSDEELSRGGDFAEYGQLTLRALIHYLRSHDQQHLAGIQWLAGKITSEG